jgi:hypothetical protein
MSSRRSRSPRTPGNPPPGVPQFVFGQQLWPYTAGESFVASLIGSGGTGRSTTPSSTSRCRPSRC